MTRADIKRMLDIHKKVKLFYYLKNGFSLLIPVQFFQAKLKKKLASSINYETNYLTTRVNYYNKLTNNTPINNNAKKIETLKLGKTDTTYFFDNYAYIRYFDMQLKANFLFRDIIHVPEVPTIVKSRPITQNNANSILLNLNKIRHFNFINDQKQFIQKKEMLVWRATVSQPHRIRFMDMYYNHPLCNIGQINKQSNHQWIKDRLTINEHLDYKFILCLEGNDVATNLKWVMSSNSIAVMPKPSYETWFMEGTLLPNFHYIEIKDDYSDLEEKIQYYKNNTNTALQIIKNAHEYVSQFKNKKRETLISLLVLQKYFYKTNQLELSGNHPNFL